MVSFYDRIKDVYSKIDKSVETDRETEISQKEQMNIRNLELKKMAELPGAEIMIPEPGQELNENQRIYNNYIMYGTPHSPRPKKRQVIGKAVTKVFTKGDELITKGQEKVKAGFKKSGMQETGAYTKTALKNLGKDLGQVPIDTSHFKEGVGSQEIKKDLSIIKPSKRVTPDQMAFRNVLYDGIRKENVGFMNQRYGSRINSDRQIKPEFILNSPNKKTNPNYTTNKSAMIPNSIKMSKLNLNPVNSRFSRQRLNIGWQK